MWYNSWQTPDCSDPTACWSNAFSLMGGCLRKGIVGSQCARSISQLSSWQETEASCKKLFKSFSRNMKVVTRPESQLFLLNSDTFQNNFKVHGLANILLTPNWIQISITFLRNWTSNFTDSLCCFTSHLYCLQGGQLGFFSDRHYEVQHMSREVAPGKCSSKVSALHLHQLPGWRDKNKWKIYNQSFLCNINCKFGTVMI